ncbi:MAG: matrixin family metalloprotease [Erysipelotrichaceae bacterium]|nr:matrixin family metalloprotease [Erysipelotrichaceae bacterium]
MLIRKLAKITIVCIMACVLFASNPFRVHAANTPTQPFDSDYKYVNGVGNITVWLNYSSGVGYWEYLISPSANNWMYTGWANPIYITFVSSNYGSNMDFHSNNNAWFSSYGFGNGTLAVTWHFLIDDTNINPNYSQAPTSSWYYAEIHINDDQFTQSTFSDAAAGGTIRHEMGHAFGLAHNNCNPNSIMHQYYTYNPCDNTYEYRVVQTIQQTDNTAINNLYGYGN